MAKAMADQEQEDIQRWTTERKAARVVSIIKGKTSIQEAARQHGITGGAHTLHPARLDS